VRPPSELSRLGAPSVRRLLSGLYSEFANWYVLGPLGWVVLPSRCPPKGGIPSVAGKRLIVKTRSGYQAESGIDEFFGFFEVFALGVYDVPDLNWSEVRTIVDVGANVGAATLWFARRAPHAIIVAVEPASKVRSILNGNIRANRLEGRVEVLAAALAGRTGLVEFDQPRSSVAARIVRNGSGKTERVRAVSLEDLLDGCGLAEVDLLKLDCEGAEFDALLSSDARVLRRNRVIVGEYHSASRAELEQLIARLNEAGFATSSSDHDSVGLFEAVRM